MSSEHINYSEPAAEQPLELVQPLALEADKPRLAKWAQEEVEVKAMLGLSRLPEQRVTGHEWQRFSRRLANSTSAAEQKTVQEEVIMRSLCSLYAKAKQYHEQRRSSEYTLEDWFQAAIEGAVAAMNHCNPSNPKHTSFRRTFFFGAKSTLAQMLHKKDSDSVVAQESLNRLTNVVGSDTDDLVEATDHSLRKSRVAQALQILPPKEQAILTLRFGLTGDTPMTLEEVGKELDSPIARQRVRDLEDRALRRLRTHPESQSLREEPQAEHLQEIGKIGINSPDREARDSYAMRGLHRFLLYKAIKEDDGVAQAVQAYNTIQAFVYANCRSSAYQGALLRPPGLPPFSEDPESPRAQSYKVDKHDLARVLYIQQRHISRAPLNHAAYIKTLNLLERHGVIHCERNERGSVIESIHFRG